MFNCRSVCFPRVHRYNSVKHDNDFIYHERVPDKATLSSVRPASLVKPLPFDPSNTSIAGPDLFAKLVPLEAHLVASSYRLVHFLHKFSTFIAMPLPCTMATLAV